jgi:hypothetical protein
MPGDGKMDPDAGIIGPTAMFAIGTLLYSFLVEIGGS